jgi:hypothetical protein
MENTTTTETPATTETVLATQTAATETTTQTPPAPSLTPRPDYIPAKFWDESKGEPKLDQLGASYISLEKAFSSKREIKKPGADAKPEDIAAYQAEVRKITGAPEKPEGYGLKAPDNLPEGVEWNAELATKAATIAHKYSVPPEALHELIALNNENMSGLVAKSAEAQKAQREEMIAGLNAEWKDQAANNWQRAARGAVALGIDINTSELANNAEFIKAALAVDKLIGEDQKLIGVDSAQSTYEERMDKIRASDAYQGKLGPAKQEEAAAQLRQLFNASRAK